MSALGRFGRFTLTFQTLAVFFLFCVVFWVWGVCCFVVFFCFLFCKCFGIPNSPRSLDLDDRQGLIASSAMQQNILYVWFPASWGPSVVEAIQTRNVTCLAKKPIVRDPHIFDRKEAARGSRAREVTCRIRKWNIKAEGFHPILVANARVDWLAMDDDDITKKFPILLEGILQDVYSQRGVSAWQGAQPQKLTVSMLLPGTSSSLARNRMR